VFTIADVVSSLDGIAPFWKAAVWDPVGLQFGDPAAECTTIGVCHEVTEPVVDRLVASPVDLLVSYHPLLFQPTSRLVAGPSSFGRAFRLIRAGVSVAAVHTAFDVAPGGAADALSISLDLREVSGFGPLWGPEAVKLVTFAPAEKIDEISDVIAAAGGGRIGSYRSCSFRSEGRGTFLADENMNPVTGIAGRFNNEAETRLEMIVPGGQIDAVVAALIESHPYEEPAFDLIEMRGNAGLVGRVGRRAEPIILEELAAEVRVTLGGVIRVAKARNNLVKRVAVVPGSGRSFIRQAALAGADVLVTGDIGHHDARKAIDLGMSVIDPGHAPTERPGIEKLYAAVSTLAETVDLTSVDAGPWEEPL